jgi:hypothetical protein
MRGCPELVVEGFGDLAGLRLPDGEAMGDGAGEYSAEDRGLVEGDGGFAQAEPATG